MAGELRKDAARWQGYQEKAETALKNPGAYFSQKVLSSIGKTEMDTFYALSDERRKLFWLLARMSLTKTQAYGVYYPEARRKKGVFCSDSEILENPYILYEKTRREPFETGIPVRKIDMAVCPPEDIRRFSPVQAPSAAESADDRRRIRAYLINILEERTLSGHTVYPSDRLIEDINGLPMEPPCRITGDVLNGCAAFLGEELKTIECAGGEKAYQLNRLFEMDEMIRSSVRKRLRGARHEIDENWREIIDHAFTGQPQSERGERARTEKTAILKELAESRLSVLIGGAGTGKTTLLALLCKSEQIRSGGVLLLAPTGKARVRLSQAMQAQGVDSTAKTVAQFLAESRRFDGYTMEYRLSEEEAQNVLFTVIIDESSMLTEEMFAALLQALRRNARRIIFVGDPNQLPPIGAGRPFVDLVRYLNNNVNEFPRVGKGFGELTVTMRQFSEDGSPRGDTELSRWYADDSGNLDDSIFIRMQEGKTDSHVSFKSWSSPEELEQKIFESIAEETCMEDVNDIQGFDLSIGGNVESG